MTSLDFATLFGSDEQAQLSFSLTRAGLAFSTDIGASQDRPLRLWRLSFMMKGDSPATLEVTAYLHNGLLVATCSLHVQLGDDLTRLQLLEETLGGTAFVRPFFENDNLMWMVAELPATVVSDPKAAAAPIRAVSGAAERICVAHRDRVTPANVDRLLIVERHTAEDNAPSSDTK